MSYSIPITNEPKQAFSYDLEGNNIEFEIEYLVTQQRWKMNIIYNDEIIVNGMFLSSDLLQLYGYNLPFDVYVEDVNSLGFSPFNLNNFEDGYYIFNIVDNITLEEARGYEVQL